MATSKDAGARGWTLPKGLEGQPGSRPPPPRPASRGPRQRGSCIRGAGPALGWSRNPGQPTSPGYLGPQSILGLERTHPKAGITWKGWSQTPCHALWTFMPKVTELTQKTCQRKSPNASEARRPVWPQSGSRLATHPGPGLPHRPGRPPCLLGTRPASRDTHPASWGAHLAYRGAHPASRGTWPGSQGAHPASWGAQPALL